MTNWIMPIVILLAVSGWAHAADPVLATAGIIHEQRVMRADIEAGVGRYKDMPSVKRQAIVANQDKLFALLEGKTTTAELNAEQKTQAFNALEAIAAVNANKEDERMVCERQKPVGSNFVTRVCKSVTQINAERAAAREGMQGSQGICNSEACRP